MPMLYRVVSLLVDFLARNNEFSLLDNIDVLCDTNPYIDFNFSELVCVCVCVCVCV